MEKNYTNEKLSKKFKSNFELVNYAIQLADNMIKSGRDPRVKSHLQNRAMLILDEIIEGKDKFDEITHVEVEVRAPRSEDKAPAPVMIHDAAMEPAPKKKVRLLADVE